jgi:hypothetical protein
MLTAAANSGIAAGRLPFTGYDVDAPVVTSEKQVDNGLVFPKPASAK